MNQRDLAAATIPNRNVVKQRGQRVKCGNHIRVGCPLEGIHGHGFGFIPHNAGAFQPGHSPGTGVNLYGKSTGRVIKLNSVVRANRAIPIHSSEGKVLMKITPANKTQDTMLLEKETTGTRALRILSQA